MTDTDVDVVMHVLLLFSEEEATTTAAAVIAVTVLYEKKNRIQNIVNQYSTH